MVYVITWFGLVFSGFFSGLESGIYSLNKLRLRLYREQESMPDSIKTIYFLRQEKESLLYMTLLYSQMGIFISTFCAARSMEALNSGGRCEIWTTLLLAPCILIISETFSRYLFHYHADTIIYKLGFWIHGFTLFLLPSIAWIRKILTSCLLLLEKEPKMSLYAYRNQMVSILFPPREAGLSTPTISTKILKMEDTPVSKVMVPFEKVVFLPKDFSRNLLLEKTRQSGFTRFPVYDGETKEILGIANFYDLYYLHTPLRPPVYIQSTESIRNALPLVSREKQPMLVVVDEDEKILGITTIKNLMEYILGPLPE